MSPGFGVVSFDGARGEAGTGPLAGYVGDSNFVMENFVALFLHILRPFGFTTCEIYVLAILEYLVH